MTECEMDLIARAQSGDTAAFDQLVGQHQARVHALAQRMTGDADDAADVQQETFVRAWKALRGFRKDAQFATWLHRITVNLCLSRSRRPRRELSIDAAFFDDSMGYSQESGAISTMERTELAVEVRRVVAAMPAHFRVLIVLREIEGRAFAEVASILGCSEASARVRTSKARNMLRERMRAYLGEGQQ